MLVNLSKIQEIKTLVSVAAATAATVTAAAAAAAAAAALPCCLLLMLAIFSEERTLAAFGVAHFTYYFGGRLTLLPVFSSYSFCFIRCPVRRIRTDCRL